MSIATAIQNAQAKVAAAYTSCNAKGATMPATQDLAHLDDCIDSIPTGGGAAVEEKEINFWDWDGTLVASWALSELQGKTELPTQPEHQGFTNQGWNWTLAQLKTENAPMDVGALAKTTDGKVRLYITILDYAIASGLTINLKIVPKGATIDWGDGSATETFSSNSGTIASHTYASRDSFVITITPPTGARMRLGYDGDGLISNSYARPYLTRVDLADGIDGYAFMLQKCINLKSINFPVDSAIYYASSYILRYTNIPVTIFAPRQDYSGATALTNFSPCPLYCLPPGVLSLGDFTSPTIRRLNVPKSVTTIGNSFMNGTPISRVCIGDSVTSLGNDALRGELKTYIEIGANVATLGNNALYNAKDLVKLRFKGATPPTAGSSGVFGGLPTSCIISVPTGKLSAYQSESNYPDPNTYTYIEE